MRKFIPLAVLLAFLCIGCGHQTPSADTTPAIQQATQPVTEPPTQPPTEPTEPPYIPTQAELLLEEMTLEEKVGQMFLGCCPDVNATEDIAEYHLGGYLLFGRDFENRSPEQVRANIASYQEASDIPMLIAVDEEGGTVARVSAYSQFRSSRFPSPRKLYNEGGIPLIVQTEVEKCELLTSLGINVNLAPVCDISTQPGAFMYSRSLGQSPEITGQFITAAVNTMTENSVGSVLKHFPGYGNNDDTHTGIAVDHRELAYLQENDLIPFESGIAAGCGGIMVSHTFVNCIDTEYPASLSPAVHAYIRQEMGYDGVLVTDDMSMQAITQLYGAQDSAVLAVLAGNDLICCVHYSQQIPAVIQAVEDGSISMEQIDQSVLRILRWKTQLGLI